MTADHAARGKLAAVSEGYWSDGFAQCVASGVFERSPGPLINRGQYARVAAAAANSIGVVLELSLTASIGPLQAGQRGGPRRAGRAALATEGGRQRARRGAVCGASR